MAGLRRRRKSGGITYTSTNKGWTTSTSSGAGKKNGLGHRITTTRRADGKTVIRTTERAGQGWFKTTQKTLSSKDPYKLTQRDFNKILNGKGTSSDSAGAGFGILVVVGIIGLVWILELLVDLYNQVVAFIGKYSIVDFITVISICCILTYMFLKLIAKVVK